MQSNNDHCNGHSTWVDLVARGLYASGSMRILQAVSGSYDLISSRHLRWRKTVGRKFVILCYHRIGAGGIPLYSSFPVSVFEKQIRFLKKHYRVVSLSRLCDELQNSKGNSTRPGVAITFDDGYRDTYLTAFPVLQKYQVPATVFLTVGSIETGEVAWYDRIFLALKVWPGECFEIEVDRSRRFCTSSPQARHRAALEIISLMLELPDWQRRQWCSSIERRISLPSEELENRMLTWEQVREMHRAGISFGSHTMTHPPVSRLTPTELEKELSDSKCLVEDRIDASVNDFAFPFGGRKECGTTASHVIARCGYRSAATTLWGCNRTGVDPYDLRRVQVDPEPSLALFALRLSQAFLHTDQADKKAQFGEEATSQNGETA